MAKQSIWKWLENSEKNLKRNNGQLHHNPSRRTLRFEQLESRELLSITAAVNDLVKVTDSLNVRAGPGLNSAFISDPDYHGPAPSGTIGLILGGPVNKDGYTWWKVDYGLYSGWSSDHRLEKISSTNKSTTQTVKQVPVSLPDTKVPTVSVFDVSARSGMIGQTFTIQWTVYDTGGSGLNRVELWRASDHSGTPTGWTEVKRTTINGNGPVSGSFYDAPALAGSYWYGIHAVDNTGNWSPEPNPIRVIISNPPTTQLPTITAMMTPSISSVSPSPPQATDGRQNFTIYGSNFDGSAYVNLYDQIGTRYQLSGDRISSRSGMQITVNPNFTSNSAGTWQAEVVNGSGKTTGRYSFQVVAVASTPSHTSTVSTSATIWSEFLDSTSQDWLSTIIPSSKVANETCKPYVLPTAQPNPERLTEADYQRGANSLGVEVAVLKAVAMVESSGSAFLPDGQPTIAFEAKVFHNRTNGKYDLSNPIVSGRPKTTSTFRLNLV